MQTCFGFSTVVSSPALIQIRDVAHYLSPLDAKITFSVVSCKNHMINEMLFSHTGSFPGNEPHQPHPETPLSSTVTSSGNPAVMSSVTEALTVNTSQSTGPGEGGPSKDVKPQVSPGTSVFIAEQVGVCECGTYDWWFFLRFSGSRGQRTLN